MRPERGQTPESLGFSLSFADLFAPHAHGPPRGPQATVHREQIRSPRPRAARVLHVRGQNLVDSLPTPTGRPLSSITAWWVTMAPR